MRVREVAHDWKESSKSMQQHCKHCKLTRDMAGAWWLYTRGRHYFGVISPAPPCDPDWPPASKKKR